MASFLPVRPLSRSQNIRIGQPPNAVYLKSQTVTYYVDISIGSVRRDLAHHMAIGAVVVVGALTASNLDEVVSTGGVVTAGTGLKVLVSAGEMRVRSTGVFVAGAADPGSGGLALTAADGTQDRTDLVHWDGTTGVLAKTNGTLAAAGTSVRPATPAGKVPLASVLVAATVTVPGTITDLRPR